MSRHAACYTRETTDKLSYSSLAQDEIARKQTEFTLPKSPRFSHAKDMKNGNIMPLVVESERDPDAGPLSPAFKVNTNTRTQFKDSFYESHMSIADNVSSPKFRNSVMKLTGHLSMDHMAATDPRQHTVRPAHSADVGPGCYDHDPMHVHTTGMAAYHPDESHHMIAFSKDPARPSPAFLAIPRVVKDPRHGVSSDTSAIPYLPHDFNTWTSAGCFMPKQPRNIQSERWGANAREIRPPPNDLVYDPQIRADGRAATCSAYSQAPDSPAYRNAFHSGLPRLIALPSGNPDTRICAKSHEALSGTPPSAGPGAYSLEPPRFKSFHAAYSHAQPYHSLASETPPATAVPSRREATTTRLAPPATPHSALASTSASIYKAVSQANSRATTAAATAVSLPSSPIGRVTSLGARSHGFGVSPTGYGEPGGLQPELSADDDWVVHQALMRSHFQGDGIRLPSWSAEVIAQVDPASLSAAGMAASAPDGGDVAGWEVPAGTLGNAADTASKQGEGARDAGSMGPPSLAVSPSALAVITGELPVARAQSAPTSPVAAPFRRAAGRFDSLAFLRRAVPYNSLLKARVDAAADIKKARRELSHLAVSSHA